MDLLLLFSGFYWLETILASHIRLRRAARKGGGVDEAFLLTDRMFRVNAESCAFYWGFIAVVSLFFWVFFYVAG